MAIAEIIPLKKWNKLNRRQRILLVSFIDGQLKKLPNFIDGNGFDNSTYDNGTKLNNPFIHDKR